MIRRASKSSLPFFRFSASFVNWRRPSMDIQTLLFYLFAVASTLYIVHFGFYLTGANLYDIWQFKRQRRLTHRTHYPRVTIGVAAHNETKVIVRCLESIRRSHYLDVEVIVADDASVDCTKQLVRDYMLRHPAMNLRVYRMRKNVGKGEALNAVLRRYATGELVMTLDADSIITEDTIQNAVSYFDDPTIAGVAANVQVIHEPTMLGVLQRFEHMIGYRSKKAYSLLNCEFVIGGVASTYRMSTLRDVNFYDADTVTEDIGLSIKIVSRGNRAHRI